MSDVFDEDGVLVLERPAALKTDQDRLGIGGNNPPDPMEPDAIRGRLNDGEAPLLKRRDALLAGVARFREAFPVITNEEDQSRAGDFLKQIAATIKVSKDHFTVCKKPYLDGGRIVDAFFKEIAVPLESGMEIVRAPMTAYANEQERIRRAEAKRLAEEAAAKARQVAEQAAAAQRAEQDREEARRRAEYVPPAPVEPAVTLDDAIAAAQLADSTAKAAAARPAEFSRTRGDMGSVSSLRERVTVELYDISLVPREFLMFNEAAARKAAQDGLEDIPGVRIVRSQHIQVR